MLRLKCVKQSNKHALSKLSWPLGVVASGWDATFWIVQKMLIVSVCGCVYTCVQESYPLDGVSATP